MAMRPFSRGSTKENIENSPTLSIPENVRTVSPIGSVTTPHTANIFDAKFFQCEKTVATCAGDGLIAIMDIETKAVLAQYTHPGRVKRLGVSDENTFYAACENATLYHIDVREKNNAGRNVVISYEDLGEEEGTMELKCVDVHNGTNKVAIGSNSSVVRIFDSRKIKFSHNKTYCPGSFSVNGRKSGASCTDIRFSSSGAELLANLGQDHIYTFNILQDNFTKLKLPEIPSPDSEHNLAKLPKILEDLKQAGNQCFHEDEFYGAEQLYSFALYHEKNHPVLLSNCAAALFRRHYNGDMYHSFRLSHRALHQAPLYRKCRLRAIDALKELKLIDRAKVELELLLEFDSENSSKKDVQKVQDKLEDLTKPDQNKTDLTITGQKVREMKITKELEKHIDYANRFIGHSNCHTDIKEANFLGSDYITAGSDCGNLFIWHRSGRLVFLGKGDNNIVNCVQPNEKISSIATSGIDSEIKLWEPIDERYSDAFTLNTSSQFFAEHCEENQETLRSFSDMNFDYFAQNFTDQFHAPEGLPPQCRNQ